jgi:ABC-type Na+ efflux pump permease subunit
LKRFCSFYRVGLKLAGSLKLANEALGPIMFWEISLALFNFAIQAYFILSLYALFVNPFSWVVLTFVVFNFLLAVIAAFRIWNLTASTESIRSQLSLAKDLFQNYKVLRDRT